MTKCLLMVRLATALAVATGYGCAGPEGIIGPEGGNQAPTAVASSPLAVAKTPLKSLEGRKDRPNRRDAFATPYLSGYAIHNRNEGEGNGPPPGNSPPGTEGNNPDE